MNPPAQEATTKQIDINGKKVNFQKYLNRIQENNPSLKYVTDTLTPLNRSNSNTKRISLKFDLNNHINLLLEQEDVTNVKPTIFSATQLIEEIQIIMPAFQADFEEKLQFKTYSLQGEEVPNEFMKFMVPEGLATKTVLNKNNLGALDAFLKDVLNEKQYFQLCFQKQEISNNKYFQIDPQCDLLKNSNSQCLQYLFVL